MSVGVQSPPRPPVPVGTYRGGGSDWVALTRARDDIDAHLLTGRLGEAGIETRTLADRDAPISWAHGGSNPWAPVTVLVRRRQLDDAKVVLAEISYGLPEPSPAVEEVAAPRVPLVWWLVALGLGLILSAITLAQAADLSSRCARDPSCVGSHGGARPAR